MYESRAIGRYLTTLGSGPELIPTEPKARAKFEQAASVEYAQFDPIASGIIFEKIIKQYIGLTTNEEHAKALITQLETKLDGYEAILSKQKYLAGDVRSFGLGDRVEKHLDLNELFLSRKSPSQTYSICRLVNMSLRNSDWAPWRNVQIYRGKRYVSSLEIEDF
jgi:hypothetical protein